MSDLHSVESSEAPLTSTVNNKRNACHLSFGGGLVQRHMAYSPSTSGQEFPKLEVRLCRTTCRALTTFCN